MARKSDKWVKRPEAIAADELDEGQRIENDRIEREAWETKMTENLVDLFKEELGDQPERG